MVIILRKNILVFGEDLTQELDDTTRTVEVSCPFNFTKPGKRFVFCIVMEAIVSYLLLP